ncbi:MAG: dioxygenase [Pseudomonadota bacterium]|nr:dioxygenase [Pseudomonadota bacterium]
MLPALFLSHGSPTLVLDDVPARDFLRHLAGDLPRPDAIIVASAHWDTALPTVTAVARNETIHDFSGFPRELYQLSYPAPGSVTLAERVTDLLAAEGLDCRIDNARGLDHGAWVPMMLMYPSHNIPVIQLSLQSRLGPGHHFQLGKALAPLRRENVLIVGSGNLTHNLREMGPDSDEDPAWVGEFAQWMNSALVEGRTCDLMSWRTRAPHAQRNHPTDEHLLPLFVALGAAAGEKGPPPANHLHASTTFGVLRMDAYAFS